MVQLVLLIQLQGVKSVINLAQYKQHILVPVLEKLEMNSPETVALMVGTGLQESGFKYLMQLGGGPAVGFYQMEMNTAEDIVYRYTQNKKHEFRVKIMKAVPMGMPLWLMTPEELKWELTVNLALQVLLTRLKYYMVPDPIPPSRDLRGHAEYWKQHYNTPLGAGTVEQYINNWEKGVNNA
jgi:hypothetical protein